MPEGYRHFLSHKNCHPHLISLRAINCAILKVHRAGENTKTEERLRAGAVGEEKSNFALGCPDSAVIMPTSGLSITPGFQQTTV